jgi:hypothetical protein
MLDILLIIVAGLFIPIFPMSMVFNFVIDHVRNAWVRSVLILIWPAIGTLIIHKSAVSLPQWVFYLALFTSAFYALRALSLREVGQWSGFIATSFWSLLWVNFFVNTPINLIYIFGISMGLPVMLIVHLAAGLETRFGAAYTGLYGGLARTIPRYSGVLVAVIVAVTATPIFPTFFIMLDMVIDALIISPVTAIIILLVWLLWSWAGARLIQGLIVGRASEVKINDLPIGATSIFSLALVILASYGLYMSGVVL